MQLTQKIKNYILRNKIQIENKDIKVKVCLNSKSEVEQLFNHLIKHSNIAMPSVGEMFEFIQRIY